MTNKGGEIVVTIPQAGEEGLQALVNVFTTPCFSDEEAVFVCMPVAAPVQNFWRRI